MNTSPRVLGCLLLLVGATAAELATVVTKADLDPAVGAEWVAGKTSAISAERMREGPSHLNVGTVIARSGSLSVLKPDAAYPGDPGDDSHWLAAKRVEGSTVVATADAGNYATWVLPPGTTTRALR